MSLKKVFSKTATKAKVTFTLPSKAVNGGKDVTVVGEWDGWNVEKAIPMKKFKNEYRAVVELNTGRNWEFRYLIDNSTWENDWAADGYVANPFGFENSVVTLPGKTKKTPAKKTTKKVTAKKATTTTKKAKTTKKVAAKKATTTTKKTTKKADDLKKIEGIGPKIASLLKAAGIVTFADLSKASKKKLTTVLQEAGTRFKMHDPTTWPKQAKMAAKGDWTALKAWQDELNGGKA